MNKLALLPLLPEFKCCTVRSAKRKTSMLNKCITGRASLSHRENEARSDDNVREADPSGTCIRCHLQVKKGEFKWRTGPTQISLWTSLDSFLAVFFWGSLTNSKNAVVLLAQVSGLDHDPGLDFQPETWDDDPT